MPITDEQKNIHHVLEVKGHKFQLQPKTFWSQHSHKY